MSDSSDTPPLADTISVLSGFPFPSAQFTDDVGKPLIRIRDLGSTGTETNFTGHFDPAFLIRPDDVLIGMDGDFNVVRWKGPEGLLNQRVCKVSSISPEIDARFLFWWLQPHIETIHRRTPETTVRHLSVGDIYRIPKPPILADVQAVAAAVLDTVDEAIGKTESVITKLRQVRAGLLDDLLTRGLDHNGQLRDPAVHPEQFKDSALGRIPQDWMVGNLPSLAINRDARRVPLKQADRDMRHGRYPYYGASGIIDHIDDYLFDGTFVLIGEDGENLRSRQVPLAFVVSGKFWVNNHAHVLEPLPNTDVRFLATTLEAQDYVPWLLGSAQPKLTQRNLETVPFKIPPLAEQKAISDILFSAESHIAAELRELEKLGQLSSGLVKDLLTGRVRVPATVAGAK
jgi:type I restriction enzyme S subunit